MNVASAERGGHFAGDGLEVIRVLIFFAVLAIALVYSVSSPGRVGLYHNFEGRCLDCHIKRPAPGEKNPTLRKDVTPLCLECHTQEDGLTHPVDIKPSMEVPSFLPLDWRGMVTCVTCHEVHKHGFGASHMRTRAEGQGFCLLCHGLEKRKMHGLSGVSVHRKDKGRLARVSYSPQVAKNGSVVRLDEMSLKCMSCHDSVLGPDSTTSNLDILRSRHSNVTGLTHPVGVSYAEAKKKYMGAYRDISDLPPQIKFYGGMVGCGTCHSPYSNGHAQLVMSNYGSNLCLACHVK
ncbi:MAG: cytochrome c3 family protein [Thermodesulfobacteriota bacterium]